MSRGVWPGRNFWYCLAFILSPSWVFSFLAMDFLKKTTPPLFVILILTIFLLSFFSNLMLLKFYFFPPTDLFRSYTDAKKAAGYAIMLVANVGLNYFAEKSVASMLTFISLSLYCLCTLFCIQPHTDFGALEFLLGGSVTQAFKRFGGRSPISWLVVIACIVIVMIRYRLEPKEHSPLLPLARSEDNPSQSGINIELSSGDASSHEDQPDQLEAGQSTSLKSRKITKTIDKGFANRAKRLRIEQEEEPLLSKN